MCERHHGGHGGGGIGLFVLGVVIGSVIAHKRSMLHGGFGYRRWGPPGEGGPEGFQGPRGPWAHHGGVPPMIQELHRRMHEQDKETPAQDAPAQA